MFRQRREGARHRVLDTAPDTIGFDHDAVEFERIGESTLTFDGPVRDVGLAREPRMGVLATNHHHRTTRGRIFQRHRRGLAAHRCGPGPEDDQRELTPS